MTLRDDIAANPGAFDFFRVMREFERSTPHKPRIGDSSVLAEDVVLLAQNPFLVFPDSNLTGLDETPRGTPRLYTQFLGYFGPQGALPLNTTEDVLSWFTRDQSFPRFTDVFANRFRQLFYRAWADAQPIAQYDRPKQDRFFAYLGSFAGIGTPASRDRDLVEDIAKLPFAGLVGSRVKSARRLSQLLRGVFHLDLTIIERIGSWLVFEPSDRMTLGMSGSALGSDTFLGVRSYSINDKFRISIKTTSLEQYKALLPNGPIADRLADLVFFYVGHRFAYDVELGLPARLAPPTRLGESGQLGWTSWIAPPPVAEDDDTYLTDARFELSERRAAAKAAKAVRRPPLRKPKPTGPTP